MACCSRSICKNENEIVRVKDEIVTMEVGKRRNPSASMYVKIREFQRFYSGHTSNLSLHSLRDAMSKFLGNMLPLHAALQMIVQSNSSYPIPLITHNSLYPIAWAIHQVGLQEIADHNP